MFPRVLLVEDSAPMRQAISRLLAPQCNDILQVEDGRNAVSSAVDSNPDVILLDISLPGIGGLTLLPLLRAALPSTTIVMLTNHTSEEYVREAFRRGADGYVFKAEAHELLLPAIRQSLTHNASGSGSRSERASAWHLFPR